MAHWSRSSSSDMEWLIGAGVAHGIFRGYWSWSGSLDMDMDWLIGAGVAYFT